MNYSPRVFVTEIFIRPITGCFFFNLFSLLFLQGWGWTYWKRWEKFHSQRDGFERIGGARKSMLKLDIWQKFSRNLKNCEFVFFENRFVSQNHSWTLSWKLDHKIKKKSGRSLLEDWFQKNLIFFCRFRAIISRKSSGKQCWKSCDGQNKRI